MMNCEETVSMRNEVSTISIRSLLGKKFYISNYQRGYRWTKYEVYKLVDDLFRYFQEDTESTYYCLQPLVIRERDDGSLELIDGQQRCTTLFLLLKYLLFRFEAIRNQDNFYDDYIKDILSSFGSNIETPFYLEYQTRIGSWDFLKNISKVVSSDCHYIDYTYIYNAYSVIKDYFTQNSIGLRKILDFLIELTNEKDRVRFIWYDVTEKCSDNKNYPRELFSRLNIGRIPLTNAELIKSLFLNGIDGQLRRKNLIDEDKYTKDARNQYYDAIGKQIQYRISMEWDTIEQKLNESDFWSFLYGKDDGRYQTRIELLFDLIAGNTLKAEDRYYTFSFYDDEFRSNNGDGGLGSSDNIISCKEWRKVMDLFFTFCSWYEDRDVYHYVGFLRYMRKNLDYLKRLYDNATNHSAFLLCLRKESLLSIDKQYEDGISKENLMQLSYQDDREAIKSVLLLFNIENIRKTRAEERFSFGCYYSQKYDLEHIKPQTPNDLTDEKDLKSFIISGLEFIIGCNYPSIAELRQEFYENDLKSYAEKDQENGKIIKGLISKRRRQNPFSEAGKKRINDIDCQLLQLVPSIRQRKVSEKDCEKYFMVAVDSFLEKNDNEHSSDIDSGDNDKDKAQMLSLTRKLVDKFKILCSGEKATVNDCFSDDEKYILGIEKDSGPDTIGNLVLLDEGTNRSYKNASFIVKRRFVQRREENGVYVPRSTRDVFNKMYSTSVADPMHWSENDMRDYVKRMWEVLNG